MKPLNWRIISHPMNWLVILLMLIIAGVGGHLLLSFFEQEPASPNANNNPAGYSPQPSQN